MCIGLPMRIIDSGAPGAPATHALARGRSREQRIDLRLVGPCAAGDWVLVFQGAARERLDAAHAAEIDAALDLLELGLNGQSDADADPGFALPSAMTADQLAALAGGGGAPHTIRN